MKTMTATAIRPPKTNPASADTRQRLIDSAATLFAERGFENVTVREICKESNANVAAINYHFGDKAGLYRAVVTHAIQHRGHQARCQRRSFVHLDYSAGVV